MVKIIFVRLARQIGFQHLSSLSFSSEIPSMDPSKFHVFICEACYKLLETDAIECQNALTTLDEISEIPKCHVIDVVKEVSQPMFWNHLSFKMVGSKVGPRQGFRECQIKFEAYTNPMGVYKVIKR